MRKDHCDRSNVVHFPNLSHKLVEKGMEALKNKHYRVSLRFFEQLLEMDPGHQQANLGKTINLVELGRLEEATHLCEKMLKEDIGDYFDVLQIYISILVQLGKYKKVVTMLEVVLEEDKLPPSLAESFYQLLEFSRKMCISQDVEEDVRSLRVEEPIERLADLESQNVEKQLVAIRQLGQKPRGESLSALKKFLRDENKHPILKSIILKMFVKHNVDETIYVHKFSKTVAVNPSLLKDRSDHVFSQNVQKQLSEVIEVNNPTLFHLCLQIWGHYRFAIYPLHPEPSNEFVWAAGLHYMGSQSLGLELPISTLAQTYAIKEEEILFAARKILTIENYSLQALEWDS